MVEGVENMPVKTVGEVVEALKNKCGQPDVDFEIEKESGTNNVRLVKVRHTRSILTNFVTPAALMSYVDERLANRHHDL